MAVSSAGIKKEDGALEYKISPGVASYLFVLGTIGVEWLDAWRQIKTYGVETRYATLDVLMSSIRQVDKRREEDPYRQAAMGQARWRGQNRGTTGNNRNENRTVDPEKMCRICTHNHKNKNCFKQDPELRRRYRPENSAWKVRGDFEVQSDDDDDRTRGDVVQRAATAQLKDRYLYDTGASHHFVKSEDSFLTLSELDKPFKFDQVVGVSTLTHQGTCQVTIGNVELKLKDALYSPNSSCNIVSAVRLKSEHGIFPAQ